MAGGIDQYTKLMLHCNGTDGSTTFTDSSDSGHTMTANGDAQIDTAQSVFGGASGLFDGNDYVSTPDSDDFYFDGDFTIDFRIRWNSSVGETGIIGQSAGGGPQPKWAIYGFVGALSMGSSLGIHLSTGSDIIFDTWSPSADTWYHVEIDRSGNNFYLFINGIQQGSTKNSSIAFPNVSAGLRVGMDGEGYKAFNGWLDEFRISKGVARHTSNFTSPTEEYAVEEIFSVDETIVWNETDTQDITIQQDETIIWNEESEALQGNFFQSDETVVWNETDEENVYTNLTFDKDETVVWNEEESQNITVQQDETVIWNETHSESVPQGTANLGVEIISINPLVFVSYTSPAKITKVDVSTPASITWSAVEITGLDYATSCVYNSTTGYVYISGDNGKVAKIELDDLSNQTIIDTNDTDNLQITDSLDTFFKTYISTDDSNGEIIVIDESTMTSLNTDFRCIARTEEVLDTRLDTIEGSRINSDLRCIARLTSTISTDLRCIADTYTDISQSPIGYSDIVVKINGTDLCALNDVDVTSLTITHTIDEKTVASFRLHRKHDNLDYDNQGNSSQITNNNAVVIEVDGHTEFSGNITNLACDSEGESVIVTAKMTQPTTHKNTISIPMSSVDENIHLYHCLLHAPNIEDPYLDSRLVIIGDNNQWWTGSSWTSTLSSALTFASYSAAESYIDGITETNTLFHNKNPQVDNYEEENLYQGITVDLGEEIEQNVVRLQWVGNVTTLAEEVEAGEFEPKQNWAYFWLAQAKNLITGRWWGTLRYLGTSVGSLSTDLFKITGLSYKFQKIKDDTVTDLGSYQVGSAPYQKISVKNGRKITKDRWEDRIDGLYRVKDADYDYEQYAKDIADLEYQKLQNINGNVFPITSATIDISVDGYYYYNIHLLSRINISNTTTSNIYKNNNGFPVAVKSITLSFNNSVNGFKVSLQCDNQKSLEELNEIDADYPDADSDQYINEEDAGKIHSKFDPVKWEYPA